MDGRGIVTKATRRFAQAIIAALFVLAVGPLSSALAAPSITINESLSGAPSKNPSPEFNGNTTDENDPVTVRVFHGVGQSGGEAEAPLTPSPAAGEWSAQSAALSDGTYTVIAEQSEAGEVAFSAEVTFTVDTTAPFVSLNSIPPLTNKKTPPKLEGSAGTESGDNPEVTVNLYAGSSAGGSPFLSVIESAGGGHWSYTPSNELADGTYTFQATQSDKVGNVGKSQLDTFKVDTVAPKVTLNTVNPLTNESTPTFGGSTGTVSASASTSADLQAVTVTVYKGSGVGGTIASSGAAAVSSGAWSYKPSSPLPDGMYTVRATQSDEAGNVGPSASPTFTVNTASPTVTLTRPSEIEYTSTPTFSGAAGTAPGDVQSVTLEVYSGTKVEGTPVQTKSIPAVGGAWSTNSISLKDGTYTATATQANTINPSTTSKPLTFTIKTKGPAVSLNPVAAWTNDPTPTFSGATGTAKGNIQVVTLEIYSGTKAEGTPVQTKSIPAVGGAWSTSLATPLRPDGTYTVVARQSDEAKPPNTGVSIARTLIVDTVPPQVTLTSPPAGSSTGSSSQLVSGSAGTATGDLPAVTAQLFSGSGIAGGQAPVQSVQVNAVGASWSATFAGLSPGTYTVRAVQSDDAGNAGVSVTSTFSVVSAAAGLAHPLAAFSWSPSAPHAGEKVSLLSSSTGIASPISSYAWDLAGSGAFAGGGPVNSTTFATPGKHTVQLRVTDANGLSSVAAEVIPVGAPALPFMRPFPTVRITATSLPSGIRLKLLSVRASAGALIAVKCTGHGCPTRPQSRVTVLHKAAGAPILFRRFQRFLRAGTVLEVRVNKAGETGKYTRFAIRRGKLPVRTDACLEGTSATPISCPTS